MKLLHLGDLHLGKNINGLSQIDNQRYVLNSAIELCKKEDIKHIVISGDVYDRSIPPEEAVNLLNDFLSKAVLEEKIKVYMISGNHDSKERLSCFNGILEKQGLYIDTHINKDLTMTKHVIKEDGLIINIYSLPYIYPADVRQLSGDDSIKDFEKAVIKVLEDNPLKDNEINILNAHYFVTGEEEPIRSDSEVRTSVGTIEQISYRVFDGYDYVALGHLHCPQHIGRDTVRYAGSLLRYSVDEIKQNKVFTVIDVKGKNHIEINKIPIAPLYQFEELEGTVEKLTKDSVIQDERILFFKLTDTSIVENAAGRLKIKYPHFIGLTYVNIVNGFSNEEAALTKVEGFEEMTPEQQFDNFFQFINGKEMNDLQKEIVKQIAEEMEGK